MGTVSMFKGSMLFLASNNEVIPLGKNFRVFIPFCNIWFLFWPYDVLWRKLFHRLLWVIL